MTSWWHSNPAEGASKGGFAVIGVGRFGLAVCSELVKAGADVLAIDASQRAIERLGARRDGVLRHHALRRDGTVRDTVMYSLTAGEWPEVKSHLQYQLARPR